MSTLPAPSGLRIKSPSVSRADSVLPSIPMLSTAKDVLMMALPSPSGVRTRLALLEVVEMMFE